MITKLRQIIACIISIFLILISFGILKPNLSGKFTISDSIVNDKSVISLDVDKDLNKKNRS